MVIGRSGPRTNEVVSGVRFWNWSAPETSSALLPKAPEWCIMRRCFAQMPNLPGVQGGGGSPGRLLFTVVTVAS
eukprot:15463612-Alexandrium_andersonii.AAC.1